MAGQVTITGIEGIPEIEAGADLGVIIVAAAFTVSPVLELTKWLERRWFAELR